MKPNFAGKSNPTLTEAEEAYVNRISRRLTQMKDMLQAQNLSALRADPERWFDALALLKSIVGNASNDLAFISCLLAKAYLAKHYNIAPIDMAAKPMGAPGLDIDITTTDGRRIIAEIKTTTPYKAHDFGAQQWTTIRKDFAKLHNHDAHRKFFFVTDGGAYSVLQQQKHAALTTGVDVILLARNPAD